MRIRKAWISVAAIATVAAFPATPAFAQTGDQAVEASLLGMPQVSSRHPDLFYREAGIRAYKDGDKSHAQSLLLKAARFADKPAQALLAAMYWNGDGVPRDRARGYAWMDLAADRGYPDLLASREAFWQQLDAGERRQAQAVGQEIHAEYGDEAGLRRLDGALRRERLNVIGSRTGFGGNSTVRLRSGAGPALGHALDTGPAVLGGTPVRGEQFFSPALWSAAPYASLKDAVWVDAARATGTVQVGDLQAMPAPAASSGK